ncbi:MAG: hypothetical protein ABI183_06570 [Polyangiaceae bacterium]
MARRSIVLSVFVLFSCACSNGASSNSVAQPTDAGASTVDCVGDSATIDTTCGSLGWSQSSTDSRPRNHHLSVIAQTSSGAFLYSVGGVDNDSPIANVDRAPINADGSLGAFTELTAIPRATGGMTGAIVNNVIVFAGGSRGAAVTDQAYSAVINSDGSLGAWNSAGSVVSFRMHPASIVSGSTMFVLGGFNDPNVWDDIVSANVSADGTVSAWASAGKLPGPRSHFSSTLHAGYIYIAGGLDKSAFQSSPPLATVFEGKILADGTIGNWTSMPSLPEGVCTHASFFYGGYLYLGGGLGTSAYKILDKVWRSPIGADHSLGAWEEVAPLGVARGHVHQFPVLGNHVYSVGGAITLDLKSTSEIDVGVFQ